MKVLCMITAAVVTMFATAQDMRAQMRADMSRGEIMYDAGNYEGALDELSYVLGQGDARLDGLERSEAELLRGEALLRSGRIAEARGVLLGWLDGHGASPLRVACAVSLADCDYYQGDYDKALAQYDAVNRKAVTKGEVESLEYKRGMCLLLTGRLAEAEEAFAGLRGSREYGDAATFYAGYTAYAEGDYGRARELMEQCNGATAPGRDARYYLTQMAYERGQYEMALTDAESLLEVASPYRGEMLRIAGESAVRLGEKDKGYGYLDEYMSLTDAPMATARYMLGQRAYDSGDGRGTVDMMGGWADGRDDAMGQSAYLYIGQALKGDGDRDGALLAFGRAASMNHSERVGETALYNYIATRLEGGRTPFGSSSGMCEEFLRKYPRSRYAPRVKEYLVTGYMNDDNYEKALEWLGNVRTQDAALLRAKQRVLLTLGSRDVASGEYERGAERVTEARKLAGKDAAKVAECDLWLGQAYYGLGDYERSASSLKSYRSVHREDDYNGMTAAYYSGYALFGAGNYKEARKELTSVTKSRHATDEMKADVYNRIGDCDYHEHRFESAAGNYDKALGLNRGAGDYALYQKGMMRGLLHDYAGKIALLDEMMGSYSRSGLMAQALLEKGESELALERVDDALRTYNRLVRDYASTRAGRNGALQIAITQMSAGRRDEAVKSYKAVIKNYATSQEAVVASEDLKRILADEGRLKEYVAFVNSVPQAPRIDATEIETLTFGAAERAYLSEGRTDRLEAYVSEYGGGGNVARALGYLAQQAYDAEDYDRAYGYAARLVAEYPDAEEAEDALGIKGDVAWMNGRGREAYGAFEALGERASGARNVLRARMGMMRVSRDLGDWAKVLEMADRMLESSVGGNMQRNEVAYSRGLALYNLDREDEARGVWRRLAEDCGDEYGVQSAYRIAQMAFDRGDYDGALREVERIVDSNTPHQYWLARGYILLSDVYRHQGKEFEAAEYLRSLRENYPGAEMDIFEMIDERLKK